MSLAMQFASDKQGRKFNDVMKDSRINFSDVLDFLDNPARKLRMCDSETHQDRPALAGVIRELEAQPRVRDFFRSHDSHTTRRFRQAIGVATRIIMENDGWRTTGQKGSLGKRVSVPIGTTAPGAYHNGDGLSYWFTRAERYVKVEEENSGKIPDASLEAQEEDKDRADL